jgi:hypothetical protein
MWQMCLIEWNKLAGEPCFYLQAGLGLFGLCFCLLIGVVVYVLRPNYYLLFKQIVYYLFMNFLKKVHCILLLLKFHVIFGSVWCQVILNSVAYVYIISCLQIGRLYANIMLRGHSSFSIKFIQKYDRGKGFSENVHHFISVKSF